MFLLVQSISCHWWEICNCIFVFHVSVYVYSILSSLFLYLFIYLFNLLLKCWLSLHLSLTKSSNFTWSTCIFTSDSCSDWSSLLINGLRFFLPSQLPTSLKQKSYIIVLYHACFLVVSWFTATTCATIGFFNYVYFFESFSRYVTTTSFSSV